MAFQFDPFSGFTAGQQLGQGQSSISGFLNQITDRMNEYRSQQMKGVGAEAEVRGQLRGYQSPEGQALLGGSGMGGGQPGMGPAPFTAGQQGSGTSGVNRGYTGGFVPTSYERKIGPFGSVRMENPGYEAQKSQVMAEQASRNPLTTEQVATQSRAATTPVTGLAATGISKKLGMQGMIQDNNAVRYTDIARGFGSPAALDKWLQGHQDMNSIRPEHRQKIMHQAFGYVNTGTDPNTGQRVGMKADGTVESLQ